MLPRQDGKGGGPNSFSCNFLAYLKNHSIPLTHHFFLSSNIIVIAHKMNPFLLWIAKKMGCFIVHRLDEHFEPGEDPVRARKHHKIIRLNRLADVTVFQSDFVKNNVLSHLESSRWVVIRNGGDPKIYYPSTGEKPHYVGHVTWGVGAKKRLDLLEKVIPLYPQEQFLLVGNHHESSIDFSKFLNVKMTGPLSRDRMPAAYRKMKCLYFPSENDPCPNTVAEAILSGVPVCYNPIGGTVELVRDCGLPLSRFDELLSQLPEFRTRCGKRSDLHFDFVGDQYRDLLVSGVL